MTLVVNNRLLIADGDAERLREYVLKHLAERTSDGHQSVTYLVDCIRCDTRYKFPTNHSFAMDVFEALGFTIVEGRKRRYTWEVTL